MPIAYNPGEIEATLATVRGHMNNFNSASDAIAAQYKNLDAVSEGAASQAQKEYQVKQATSRAALDDFIRTLTQLTSHAVDTATATDRRYASAAMG